MSYKQGDIVWLNYPFSDDSAKSKKRPALVVSNKKSNSLDNDLLIVPITTNIRGDIFAYKL
ncbi:type II toxin-antitoxin system PemK/MazF family toxin [Raineya orbicola]|jgi:mRNA-degrading endonuclease toxin of MazEF toxin-antitoxin module|uniref:PemK-like protein n=1 Tax=Raineya orbicola TaxID=2016530 RepID=A0A2N3IBZ9_9BACT|nr:type II toxin-antitoxin system PemK/MazF family toxin [Raineya orbicola]PKQ67851.1 PemK-like protein [Raineya orbicola]